MAGTARRGAAEAAAAVVVPPERADGVDAAPGAASRMDAVAAALDSNEKWLATELEAKARDLEALNFDQPPDF